MSDPRQAYEQSEALRPDAPSREEGASARPATDEAATETKNGQPED